MDPISKKPDAAKTFVRVCYRGVAELCNYDIGETLQCKVISVTSVTLQATGQQRGHDRSQYDWSATCPWCDRPPDSPR